VSLTPRQYPETVSPEPYPLTETENTIIDDILALLNKNELTSQQSVNLLGDWVRTLKVRLLHRTSTTRLWRSRHNP